MATGAPFQQPDIPTVRIKRHWWEILWIDVIIGIFVVVVGGLILQRMTKSGDRQAGEPSERSSQPVVLEVVPPLQNQPGTSGGNDRTTKVYAGQVVRVICKPGWVTAFDYAGYQSVHINLWVEDVIFNEHSTDFGVAVSPWAGSSEAVSLHLSSGAYVTDDQGYRYDVQKDGGSYASGERPIKPDEIYRFTMTFPRIRPTNKVILHHPQFQSIAVWFPWANEHSEAPTPTKEPLHSSGGGDAPRGVPYTFVTNCTESQEVAVFRNGARVSYIWQESIGDKLRLHTEDGYTDVTREQVDHLERCSTS